jgi:hypothetical protein
MTKVPGATLCRETADVQVWPAAYYAEQRGIIKPTLHLTQNSLPEDYHRED